MERKIEQLYLADLVYRTAARYYSFNDICLMRYIKFVYEKELEDIEEIDLSQQNLFNTLKGKFLEMVVQVTMMKFNHEKIDGIFFGKSGLIELPLFQYVNTKIVKGVKTPHYQIDVYGEKHLERWMEHIGFSNKKHLDKIDFWKKNGYYNPKYFPGQLTKGL